MCAMDGAKPILSESEVHIWLAELSAAPEAAERAWSLLAADEQERATRFRFPHLKENFTLAHGALRCLLARYVDAAPREIEFVYGEQKKPEVSRPRGRVRFNMSHSGNLAAYALVIDCEVGIDVEKIELKRDMKGIARRFFSAEECRDLMRLGGAEFDTGFFTCWTRKEAYIKAAGGGLSIPLSSFRVSLLPGERPALVSLNGNEAEASEWSLGAFDAGAGYAGAVAYRSRERRLVAWPRATAGGIVAGEI